MRRTLTVVLIGVLALAFGATAALADGSQTVAPTKAQKNGILKAWNNGKAVPSNKQQCYTVVLSKSNKVWSGLKFNSKASGCGAAAFDGRPTFASCAAFTGISRPLGQHRRTRASVRP